MSLDIRTTSSHRILTETAKQVIFDFCDIISTNFHHITPASVKIQFLGYSEGENSLIHVLNLEPTCLSININYNLQGTVLRCVTKSLVCLVHLAELEIWTSN